MRAARAMRTFELLDTPVHVRCDDAQADARLAIAYGAAPAPRRSAEPLEAALTGDDEHGWTITVAGRERLRARTRVDAIRTLNHELLQALMRRAPHLFYVHAGVVSVGGRGVVMPGLSRAGKSTLALAFVTAGARLLSDELLAFDPRAETCVAVPRALKVRDECVSYFPELAHAFVGEGEGRFLPFDALADDVVAPAAPVSAIVIPRWEPDGDDRPVATTQGQALLELAASALNFGTHRAISVDHLADTVKRAACFRIAWRDPHRAVDRLLAELPDGPPAG